MIRLPTLVTICALGWLGLPLTALQAQSARDIRQALVDIDRAARDRDLDGFIDAVERALADESPRTLGKVLDGFGAMVDRRDAIDPEDYFAFHSDFVKLLSKVENERQISEVKRLRTKAKRWPSRLIAIDIAALNDRLDLQETCLEALADKDPRVIRRALDFLRNAKTLPVLDAILERYLELENKTPRGLESEWGRTILAFSDSLANMLKVRLLVAVDYKNYVEQRRYSRDLFDPPRSSGEGITRLSLFGAEITGKNIVFVLDVSGSMMATDPIDLDDLPPGTTVVGDPNANPEFVEERRRITRATKELQKVVTNLPEDVRFNIVPYSSDVSQWRKNLERASSANKDAANEFIGELEAEGITVTDEALDVAFADIQIDTIYLITDGAPTHVGARGPAKPVDADQIIRAIHERTKKVNFLRNVRIFTLGFPEAEEEFLRKLSGDNSGKYTAIR